FVRKTLAATRNSVTIGEDLLGRRLDVVSIYFEGIDMMGHRFQHCMPPATAACDEAERRRGGRAVEAFYEYQDEAIGRLLAADPGRTVVVVSDHGFRTGADRPRTSLPYTTDQPVEWHDEEGIIVLSGPGVRSGATISSARILDVAPTLLYLAGLPASKT